MLLYLNRPAPREIYTLSLHDALPISGDASPEQEFDPQKVAKGGIKAVTVLLRRNLTPGDTETNPESEWYGKPARSEEHTSELQSRLHLVCRLLLEKKKKRHNE